MLLIGGIILYRSYALYEEEQEFNVLKGTIPDFGYDIKMLSVQIDGEKSKTIPSRGLYKTSVECSGDATTGEWDYNAWSLVLNNVESNTKCNISFTSNLTQEEYDKYIDAGKALRRNTYRGKDISSYWKDGSLYTMISNGTFDDIYVGDYIIDNNGRKWLIADIDNYLYSGDTPLTKHHATIIPATSLKTARMNAINTINGGYYGSEMVTTTLPSCLTTYVTPVFGNHVIIYRSLLTNSVNDANDASNNWEWYDRQIDLMSEVNVYGINMWSSSGYDTGSDNSQYALFQLRPEFKNSDGLGNRIGYWLKDVSLVNTNLFVYSNSTGVTRSHSPSQALGVRPRFLIG